VRARTHEGSGIGLALVQELARLHGGEVRVESATGRGSTFTVTIPRGQAHLPFDRIVPATTSATASVGVQASSPSSRTLWVGCRARTGRSTCCRRRQ
jgi:hypothetical protein